MMKNKGSTQSVLESPEVSVCILTWNTVKTLEKTLNIVEMEFGTDPYEIIVVDNGSIDGCKDYATIQNQENLGISVGKNQCIDNARGDYIFLIDGDVVPVRGSLTKMLEYMKKFPECEALGAMCNRGTDCIEHCEGVCNELVDVKPQKHPCLYYGLFNKSVFDKGVRMDESGHFNGVGYGYEDHDFFRTMQLKGCIQFTFEINKVGGRYYHEINSSIRNMGRSKYIETSKKRYDQFKDKWDGVSQAN